MTSHARAARPSNRSPDGTLRLRPLRPDDEAAFRSALQVMAAEEFAFGFGFAPGTDWSSYLKTLDDHRRGMNLQAGMVPGTFLVADVAGTILRQSLVIARAVGADRVLVTCDDDNAGSIAVIERCGGKLESVIRATPSGPPIRRYRID